MSQSVALPVGLVLSPSSVPSRCVRHGEPEEIRRRVVFVTETSLGMHTTMLVAALASVIVTPGMRNPVSAPAWPFCPLCRQEHARRLAIGRSIGVGVPVLLALLAVLTGGALPPVVVLLGSLGGIVAGLAIGGAGTWIALAGGKVTTDGGSVVIADAAPGFVAALPPG
jgi:hypothetical protein